MTLICNKKNKIKNEENQLIILKNEVLHKTSSGQKQASNFLSYHLKEAWIDSCALWFCILSKLGGNSLVTYFMKIHISA